MNKNDKFQVAEFEVNAQAVTNEELEGVSGGWSHQTCPHCGQKIIYTVYHDHVLNCTAIPAIPSIPAYNSYSPQNS